MTATSSPTDRISVTYDGPTTFTASSRAYRTLRFTLSADGPLPMGTQVQWVMGRFRSLRDNNPEKEHQWRGFDARVEGGDGAGGDVSVLAGKPILAHWSVNGHEMGEEATLTGDAVAFSATLHGTAPIERVEVISNGEIVWRSHPDAFDVTLTDEALPAPAAGSPESGNSAYYYLRLRQHDGHRAWLSPVWLDRG